MNFSKIAFQLSAASAKQFPESELPEIALVGRSNVGKSSLLNMLANQRSLAKVSKTPGRTQLVNFFLVDEHAYIVDLPGYGYASVPVAIQQSWQKLIQDYLTKRPNLAGLMLLLDIRREPNAQDIQMIDWIRSRNLPVLIVLTKCDKFGKNNTLKQAFKIGKILNLPPQQFVLSSSTKRQGIKELHEAIQFLVKSVQPKEETEETPVASDS